MRALAGDVCGSLYINPCRVGTCRNSGDGSYTCICPPGYYSGMKSDGTATCAPTLDPREWQQLASDMPLYHCWRKKSTTFYYELYILGCIAWNTRCFETNNDNCIANCLLPLCFSWGSGATAHICQLLGRAPSFRPHCGTISASQPRGGCTLLQSLVMIIVWCLCL